MSHFATDARRAMLDHDAAATARLNAIRLRAWWLSRNALRHPLTLVHMTCAVWFWRLVRHRLPR